MKNAYGYPPAMLKRPRRWKGGCRTPVTTEAEALVEIAAAGGVVLTTRGPLRKHAVLKNTDRPVHKNVMDKLLDANLLAVKLRDYWTIEYSLSKESR